MHVLILSGSKSVFKTNLLKSELPSPPSASLSWATLVLAYSLTNSSWDKSVTFDSTEFMPVPADWDTNTEDSAIRNNAVDGGIKIVVIKNRGTGIGTANQTYTRVPIKGDGFDAECTVVVNNDQQIESVTISN